VQWASRAELHPQRTFARHLAAFMQAAVSGAAAGRRVGRAGIGHAGMSEARIIPRSQVERFFWKMLDNSRWRQTPNPPVRSTYSLLIRLECARHLTAIRDEEGILTRHFVESSPAARLLPAGIQTLLDFGSGAGFPGIPIALCRPKISVTLAESQGKKAAFLQEAVRVLDIFRSGSLWPRRALHALFDCVILRAVDRWKLPPRWRLSSSPWRLAGSDDDRQRERCAAGNCRSRIYLAPASPAARQPGPPSLRLA